jgi:hypothetical protein
MTQTLATMWEEVRTSGREALWQALPENAYSTLYENRSISQEDKDFLFAILRDVSAEQRVAMRLLAILGENSLISKDEIRLVLLPFLAHPSAGQRYEAIMAFWQMVDVDVLPQLLARADVEPNEDVKATLQHVAHILKGQVDAD